MTKSFEITINKTAHSRQKEAFSKELVFGRVFSDHMFIADFIDGEWTNISVEPYAKISLDPSCLVFHYGQAIFEGMKAYKGPNQEPLLFRPADNIKRFNKSAERMCMPRVPEELFMDGLKALIELDQDWIPSAEGHSLYIRPFMIATDEYLGVKASDKYRFIIITSPVAAYYKDPVKVKVETYYTRAAEGGTGFAKSAGNYAQSLQPAKEAYKQGYDQLLWTDAKEHKFIEESGTMNVMFVLKNKKIVTPKLSTTILNGVTRNSVIQLAEKMDYEVDQKKLAVSEIIDHIKNDNLLEAFGTGTAATIAPISLIAHDGIDYELPNTDKESFSVKCLSLLDQIRRGQTLDEFNWVVKI